MFEIITKPGEYTLADQKKQIGITKEEVLRALENLVANWRQGDTPYISLLMDPEFERHLNELGFHHVSTIVEHERDVEQLEELPTHAYITLGNSDYSDAEFAAIYEACRSGSANKNNLFTIEQIMDSLELELGDGWRSLAMLFLEGDEVIGIAIPHIEAGTKDEGRLFYFGIMPKWRSRGKATPCHGEALRFLKKLGAKHYVGSTDVANQAMIRVMNNNGALERDHKGIYRLTR